MEFQEELATLSKKVDKLLNLTTKIAKTLHLIPVTEKEERDIQAMRERNAKQAYAVNENRADLKNEPDLFAPAMDVFAQLTMSDIYSDVLADDVIPRERS